MLPLSQLIHRHRKKAGLTQANLAKLAGVGKTVVWDIEHGRESVQWDILQKIFRVLNITAEWRSPLLDRTASLNAPGAPVPSSSSSSLVADRGSSPGTASHPPA